MADGVESTLDRLHAVTQRLMHAESEQVICEVAVEAAADIFDVPFAGLWLFDTEARELQQAAETEQARRLLGDDVVYRPGNSLSWKAFSEGEVRTYSEAADESKYNADSRVSSELILPLGEYGVLNVATAKADAFGSTDVKTGELLAATVETALNKTEREHALQLKNDRLEEFVGIVSHDLRNPLTVASGNLELARAADDSEHLRTVANSIDRMDTLIDDLLTLAEHGYVVENRTSLELETLAERAWSNVHTPRAELAVEGTANLFGDEARLLQVFENLFRNSVEHGSTAADSQTRQDGGDHGSANGPAAADDSGDHGSADGDHGAEPSDGVTIRVGPLETMHTSTRVSAADRADGFYVADDGPGIPDDEKETVFESGHSTSSTGLGLAIVERIVASHGWEISVADGVNRGARFEVTGGARSVSPFET